MNIPRRLNHRRRVVYAALRKALERDQRIPKLFIFWDRNFSGLDHFVISPYIEQAAAKGWLNDQEKRDLTRSLMHYMSHDYADLPEYPDEFVNLRPRSAAPEENRATPVPIGRDAQVAKEAQAVTEVQVGKEVQVANASKDVAAEASASLRQLRNSSVRKVTLTPEMMPHYLVFREVMSVVLKSLKENGRSSEEVRDLVLGLAREMNEEGLGPLLHSWADQDFDLGALPVLIEQPTTQLLVQLFYRAACEASLPPVIKAPLMDKTSLMDRVKVSEIPEIIR